jgi:hypothetical protein
LIGQLEDGFVALGDIVVEEMASVRRDLEAMIDPIAKRSKSRAEIAFGMEIWIFPSGEKIKMR